MPRKTVSKSVKTTENVAPKAGRKSTKKQAPVEEAVVEEAVQAEVAPEEKKTRFVPTKLSVLESMDGLIQLVTDEITRSREEKKGTDAKFLRTLCKTLKLTRAHSGRVMKQKTKSTRAKNGNSGFLKPVGISKEMAKFTGWDQAELKSRVDVTKFICNYIKDNDLQNPSDRRQILADKKLSTLLKYDAKKAENPLTYFRMQTYIKPHFVTATQSK